MRKSHKHGSIALIYMFTTVWLTVCEILLSTILTSVPNDKDKEYPIIRPRYKSLGVKLKDYCIAGFIFLSYESSLKRWGNRTIFYFPIKGEIPLCCSEKKLI